MDLPIRRLVKDTARGIVDHHVTDLAAMLTYYILFALFPAALFLVTLSLLVLPAHTLNSAFDLIAMSMPREVAGLAKEHLLRMEQAAASGFAVLGFALALWGASRGATSLQTALNAVHEVRETRPWWKVQLTAILVTIGVALLLVIALGSLVFGPVVGHFIADRFQLGWAFDVAFTVGRVVGAALLIMLVWASLYYFLPNVKRRFRWVTPGAITGVVLWLLVSRGFMLYTDHFGSYQKTYGALGAVIVFITWLWLSNLCFLVGGEIDDTLDEIRKKRQAEGKEPIQPEERPVKKDLQVARPVPGSVAANGSLGDLARRIGEDVSLLAKDHLELARLELSKGLKAGAGDAAAIVLGGVVGLIGFAMLCTAAVVGLAPVIPALWLRLLIMAVVYMVVGGGVVFGFVKKLKGDVPPDLPVTKVEGRRTMTALKEQVQHG